MPGRAVTETQPISVRRLDRRPSSGAGFPELTRAGWVLMSCGLGMLVAMMIEPLASSLREWPGRWFSILVVATLVSMCLTVPSAMLAVRVGALDLPDRRKVHHRPTPRLGGLAVFAGIVIALALNGVPQPRMNLLLIASTGLLIVGMFDDFGGVSARVRLVAQIVASLVVVQGGVVLTVFPHEGLVGTAANALLTVVWLVGITNAFNFFDGMDGLAAGLAIIMAGFLGAIAFMTGQLHLGWASIAIVGGCLGFLPFNFRLMRPAHVFMGECGSTVLGFLLAGLAVHGEWVAGHPLINLSTPLLIFGVLIFDMIHTTVSRIVRGDVRTVRQWLEYTGRDHLHHRFESLLRSKLRAVMLVWLLAVTLGLSALLIRRVGLEGSALLLLQCAAILLVVTILEHAGNKRERRTR
jgi:UDP-GlcNAc:undecaprenyl-phosphate GlcNAc-1-phosphate transferase